MSVQPGGRRPAPGRLSLVQAFLNTHYDLEVEHGAELLSTPEMVGEWFSNRGLLAGGAAVTPRDHHRVLALRETLRALAAANGSAEERARAARQIDAVARGAAVEVRLGGDGGPEFVPATRSGLAGGLGVLVAIVAGAIGDGTWDRLKVCPGEDCGWAFYDHSRNQTGRWCSMSICGGRAKARSHYRRKRTR